jgi:hypothetical protein
MAIEILDVGIFAQDEFVFPECQYLQHDAVVKRLRPAQIRDCDVDVVDARNFDHGHEGVNVCPSRMTATSHRCDSKVLLT